jgi:hypothetical protein
MRCADCDAIAYEGLLPKRRVDEGLNMTEWECVNKKCKYMNVNTLALLCKKCKGPRPQHTISEDIIFELFVPLNPNLEINRQIYLMEKILILMPLIDLKQDLNTMVRDLKKKEKANENQIDFDKIDLIDNFLQMRETYLIKKKK